MQKKLTKITETRKIVYSFIVPVFNTKEYLSKCMDTLLVQKGAEFEILLVDDGSTDDSGLLCDFYAREYPDVVRTIHKKNEGLLLTRRKGFREAVGDWFICVDSDDFVSPNLLSTVVKINEEQECDMVMYNYSYFNDKGDISQSRLTFDDMSIFEGNSKHIILEKRLLSNEVNSMCMRAIRRDIVDVENDYSSCGIRNMCEDAIQILELYSNAQHIVYTSIPLYFYRKHDASITSQASINNWESIFKTSEITERYLDIWNVSGSVKKVFYNKKSEQIINRCRWTALYAPNEYASVVDKIVKSELYITCLQEVDSTKMSTAYNRVCVPWLIRKINSKGNNKRIIEFFRIERIISQIKG